MQNRGKASLTAERRYSLQRIVKSVSKGRYELTVLAIVASGFDWDRGQRLQISTAEIGTKTEMINGLLDGARQCSPSRLRTDIR